MLLWRGDFNFFYHIDQQHVSPEDATVIGDNDEVDVFMSQVASCLDIKRGHRLIRESEYRVLSKNQDWYVFRVPTPPPKLFIIYPNVTFGFQDHLEAQPREQYGDCICLKPVFHPKNSRPPEVPQYTALLAQHFINSVSMRWVEDQPLKLRMQVPSYDKLLLWVRMMLVNQEDCEYLIRADIIRGVMASIYRCHVDPLLVAAFLTYWNVDAHTLITSQGEMGYPLHTLYDAMGISFSGRLYEEYIPLPSTSCEHVQILHSIYVSLCPSQLHNSGLVTISTWIDHFFET